MKRMNEKGFTLVELMVVLAILGLLAGIGVPQYIKTFERSRIAADKAALASLQSAINTFMAETDWKPGITSGTIALSAADADTMKGNSILTNDTDVPFTQYWPQIDYPVSKANPAKTIHIDLHGTLSWREPVTGSE